MTRSFCTVNFFNEKELFHLQQYIMVPMLELNMIVTARFR